jgi:hypothetical protein
MRGKQLLTRKLTNNSEKQLIFSLVQRIIVSECRL